MIGSELPNNANIVRYVGLSRIRGNRVDGTAFCLRPDETGLSIHWLNYYSDLTKERQLDQVRRLIRLDRGARAGFAELNVGETREYIGAELPTLRFVHAPSPANDRYPADPAHSNILGLPRADDEDLALMIGDLIARQVKAIHPARNGG